MKFLKMLCLAAIAAMVLAPTASVADWEVAYPAPGVTPSTGPGYLYYYDSLVQPPDQTYPTYYYYWELGNYSTDLGITSWTWAGGNVFDLGTYQPMSGQGPLPFGPAGTQEVWGFSETESDYAPVLVPSAIMFSDGEVVNHDIYVPENLVPEPGSFVALLTGLVGLGGLRLRKR